MRRFLCVLILASGCAQSAPPAPAPVAGPVMTDIQRLKHALDGRIVALFFTSPDCPMVNAVMPRMVKIAAEHPSVLFLAVSSSRTDTIEELQEHARQSGFSAPIIKDEGHELADRYRIEVTPTVVVLDRTGRLAYRGRVDDSKMEDWVSSHDLRRALKELAAGKPVSVPETEATGCLIKRAAAPVKDTAVTYTKDIAPIMQRHCQGCHRPGRIGPFPLIEAEDVVAWADDIKSVVNRRVMPPWKPVNDPGHFIDPRAMTEAEIGLVTKWADAGAPMGDAADLPPERIWKDEWALGTPDLVLSPDEDFRIPASGPDLYQSFALPTNFAEDRWVTAVEIRPGNPRVVHHIVTIVDASGAALKYDREEKGAGYRSKGMSGGFIPTSEMGGWTPGMTPHHLPDGVGRHLPKNSAVVLDIHYHPSGRPETDRTTIGLYFARKPIHKRLRWLPAFNDRLEIPAGAKRHEVRAHWTLATDGQLIGVLPHMHYRGREVRVEAHRPDGTKVTLVDIRDWDFNWQELYYFSKAVPAPKGTKVVLTCVFDNSAENPNNPRRPPVPVKWGGNTTDEMALVWVAWTMDKEDQAQKEAKDR